MVILEIMVDNVGKVPCTYHSFIWWELVFHNIPYYWSIRNCFDPLIQGRNLASRFIAQVFVQGSIKLTLYSWTLFHEKNQFWLKTGTKFLAGVPYVPIIDCISLQLTYRSLYKKKKMLIHIQIASLKFRSSQTI